MSSGYGDFVVESAEARERRLLAAATARRSALLTDLAELAARQKVLGLAAVTFRARNGDSAAVESQCAELRRLVGRARAEVAEAQARREQETARRHLAKALKVASVAPEIAAALRPVVRPAAKAPRRDDLAELAARVVDRQLVSDPAIAQQVATALEQPRERARMLLQALRDEVERRNAHVVATQQAQEERRRAAADAAAEAAGQAEEDRFVAEAVREALAAIGYGPSTRQADGAEGALLVANAAFPQHAVLARTRGGRISLDAVRIDGAADPTADTQAEDALCQGLAAFRAELSKRGVTASRVSHLPAGLRPLARIATRAAVATGQVNHRQEQHR